MLTELLEDIGTDDKKSLLSGCYSFPFFHLQVTSSCKRVLRYLDFFLEPFRSSPIVPLETFNLTVLVYKPPFSARIRHISNKCNEPRSARVCYSPVPSRMLYEGDLHYFTANETVFGVLSMEKRQCLVFFNQDSIFTKQPHFWRIFVFILTEILAGLNSVLLHGATLIDKRSGCGLCIVGNSGAGKTTLLMGLLKTGCYQFLGDEWCLIQSANKGWRFSALTPKVYMPFQSLLYFQELNGWVQGISRSTRVKMKMYIDPRKIYGNCFESQCMPRCILFLTNEVGGLPDIEPIGTFEALNRIVKNIYVPLAHDGFLKNISIASELIHSTRTFRFVRSPKLEESIHLVDSVVREL